jgi:hypothetical protein
MGILRVDEVRDVSSASLLESNVAVLSGLSQSNYELRRGPD